MSDSTYVRLLTGRFIADKAFDEANIPTSDQKAGIAAATAITAVNPPLTDLDRDKCATAFTFRYLGGFPISQTDVEMFSDGLSALVRKVMPSNFSIVKATLSSSGARSAGTLTAEITLDGVKLLSADLTMVLDGGTTNNDRAEVAPKTVNFTGTAGQALGVKLTSDETWAPVNSDIECTVYVCFET